MNIKPNFNFFIALLALLCTSSQTTSQAQSRDLYNLLVEPQPIEAPQVGEPVGLKLVLEVSAADLLVQYAQDSSHEEFVAALTKAKAAQSLGNCDLLTLFYDAYQQINAKDSLSVIFAGKQIDPTYSNQKVIEVLRAAYQSTVESAFKVLSTRITSSKFHNPIIKKLEPAGLIAIELPNIDDPQRAVKLLQRRGDIKFWPVYSAAELFPALIGVSEMLDKIIPEFKQAKSSKIESPDDIVALLPVSAEDVLNGVTGGLWTILHPTDGSGAVLATVSGCDTAQVSAYFAMPEVRALIPRDVIFMWSMMPIPETDLFELYAIKTYLRSAPLDSRSIVEAEAYYSQNSHAVVSMTMNDKGAKIWARMTADNIFGFIAITVDNYVYSCPRVNGEITGGRSEISGDFALSEAKDLANVLNSGKLPVSVRVVKQDIVEADLKNGSSSIWVLWLALSILLVGGCVVFLMRRLKSRTI